ncbi:hypothetical protein [Wukongibacter sp. M2B1]|uniref:hypothetical protein n=1 Tax=Wukongibacter sp. M2B1 TaxID=3088895 RepID=UPI003D7B1CDD
MNEIEDFIRWYEDRTDYRNEHYYIIEKNYKIRAFASRKDYIVVDKILQLEVMEHED